MPEEEFELDREYTVPLSRAWIAPRHRRMVRAVNVLREFAQRHMKSEEIKIDTELNEQLWNRGMTRPPRRVIVRMTKDEDGLVTVSLPKKPEVEEAEKAKEMLPAPVALPPTESSEQIKSEPAPAESKAPLPAEVKKEEPEEKKEKAKATQKKVKPTKSSKKKKSTTSTSEKKKKKKSSSKK